MLDQSQSSRRNLLAAALGVATAWVASRLARPLPVRAADGDTITVGGFYSASSVTEIENNVNGSTVFMAVSEGSGTGISGQSNSGTGVLGLSSSSTRAGVEGGAIGGSGTGVLGRASSAVPDAPPNTGVYGFNDFQNGTGVWGKATSTTGTNYGVVGDVYGVGCIAVVGRSWASSGETYGTYGQTQSSLGRGVFGRSLNTTSGGTGVFGQADAPTGAGVRGLAWDGSGASGKFGAGIIGSSGSHTNILPPPPANTGVYGLGANGRGGVFKGDKAQVLLIPSSATTHPSSGKKGDLFVDSSGRLWFCKGGKSWKQVA